MWRPQGASGVRAERMAEKFIQDLSNVMRCMLADSNFSSIYWDFVIVLPSSIS
jgi:hypothetical protein